VRGVRPGDCHGYAARGQEHHDRGDQAGDAPPTPGRAIAGRRGRFGDESRGRLGGRSGGRCFGGRCFGRRYFGYDGGRRLRLRDAFPCPRLRFRGGRRLRRQAIGRFGSWRRRGRLLIGQTGGRLLSGQSGRRVLGERCFRYGDGRRLRFRDVLRCLRLRFGFGGGRRLRRQAIDRFRN
jgi:hypothetical protein